MRMSFAWPLALLVILAACDSDPRDAPAPSTQDLVAAYGDQPPGQGVVHEGRSVSTQGLVSVGATFTSSRIFVNTVVFRLRNDQIPFSIVSELYDVELESVQPGEEFSGVSFYCCGGGGGVGRIVITERTDGRIGGVFYANVNSGELATTPRRYMGGFNATLVPSE